MNIVQEMLSNICRLCTNQAAEGIKMHNIFQPNQTSYPQLLSQVTWVTNLEIRNDDGLPTKLCSECFNILNQCYKFKQQCYASDRELRHFLKNLEGELKDLITVDATELQNNLNEEHGLQGVETSNTKTNTYLTSQKLPNEKVDTLYLKSSSSNEPTGKIQEVHSMDTKILIEKNITHFCADNPTNKRKLNTNDTSYKKKHSSEIGVPKNSNPTLQEKLSSKTCYNNVSSVRSNKHLKTKVDNTHSNLTEIKSPVEMNDKTTDVNKQTHHKLPRSREISELSPTNSNSSDVKSCRSNSEELKVNVTSQSKNKKSHRSKEMSTKSSTKHKGTAWSNNKIIKQKSCTESVVTSLVRHSVSTETQLNKVSSNQPGDKHSNINVNTVTKAEGNRTQSKPSVDEIILNNNESTDKKSNANTSSSSQRITFISQALKKDDSILKYNDTQECVDNSSAKLKNLSTCRSYSGTNNVVSMENTNKMKIDDITAQCTMGKDRNRNMADVLKASNILGGKDWLTNEVARHDRQTNKIKHFTDNTAKDKSNKNKSNMTTNGPNQNEPHASTKELATTSVGPVPAELPSHKTHDAQQNDCKNLLTCTQKTEIKVTDNEKSGRPTVQGATLSKESIQHTIKQGSANSKAPLQGLPSKEILQETLNFNALKKMLKSHFETQVKQYPCKYCGKMFTRTNVLKAHIRIHTGETPFSCHDCGRKFKDKRHIRSHIQSTHITDKPFKCKACPKSYFTPKELEIHERLHNNERPYKCSLCPKAYTINQNLQAHLATHLGERNFHCDLCDKSFWLNSILKSHRLTHAKERNISCQLCKKTFTTQRALKAHQISHTKERPFKCELCPATYAYHNNLKEHTRKHNGDTFNCSICSKPFIKKTKLREHLMMHTGNLHFECIPCGKTFASKATWSRHMKRIHKKETTSAGTNPDASK